VKSSVFLVEDHPLMRMTLTDYVGLFPGLHVSGTAATAEEALESVQHDRPDLMLIDVSLPGMTGLDLVERLHERWPELPCLMLSGHGQPEHVRRALDAGARGYILKGDPYELGPAIRHVLDGDVYISDTLR
jgi:DNA-binding NarL/FixJ family response regulator